MANTRPTIADDGSLLFPKRGNPPPEQEGYVRDPGDQFILRPQYPPCTQRNFVQLQVPCNRSATGFRTESFYTCQLGLSVNHASCGGCKQRTPPLT